MIERTEVSEGSRSPLTLAAPSWNSRLQLRAHPVHVIFNRIAVKCAHQRHRSVSLRTSDRKRYRSLALVTI
jgi:hypothetical protein